MLPEPQTPTSKIIHTVHTSKMLQKHGKKKQQQVKDYGNKVLETSESEWDNKSDYSSSLDDLTTPSRTRRRSAYATPTKLKAKRRKVERRDKTNLENHEDSKLLAYPNQNFLKPAIKRNGSLRISVKNNTCPNENHTDQSSDECTFMNDQDSIRSIPSTQTTPEVILPGVHNTLTANKTIEGARQIRLSKKRIFDEIIMDSEPVNMTVKRSKKTENGLLISKEAVILITTSLLSVIYGYCHDS